LELAINYISLRKLNILSHLAQKVNAVGEVEVPRFPGPAVKEGVDLAFDPSLFVQAVADVIVAPCLRLSEHSEGLLQVLLLAIVIVPVHEFEVRGTLAQVTTVLFTVQV